MADLLPTRAQALIERLRYWSTEAIGFTSQERQSVSAVLAEAATALAVEPTRALIRGTVRGFAAGENTTAKHWLARAQKAEALLSAQEAEKQQAIRHAAESLTHYEAMRERHASLLAAQEAREQQAFEAGFEWGHYGWPEPAPTREEQCTEAYAAYRASPRPGVT